MGDARIRLSAQDLGQDRIGRPVRHHRRDAGAGGGLAIRPDHGGRHAKHVTGRVQALKDRDRAARQA